MPLPWASSLVAGHDSASQLLRRPPAGHRPHGRRTTCCVDAALVTRSSLDDVDTRAPPARPIAPAQPRPQQQQAPWASAQSLQVLSSVESIRTRAATFIRTLASRIGQLPQAQALSALFPVSPAQRGSAAGAAGFTTPPDMRPPSHSVYPHPITRVDPVQGQPLLERFLERADRLEVLYASLLSDLSNMAYEADKVNDAVLQRHQLVLVSSSGKPLFGPVTREVFQQQLDQAHAARNTLQQPPQHPQHLQQQQHLQLQVQQLDAAHGNSPVAPAHPDLQSPSTLLHLASSSMDVMDLADAMGPTDTACSGYQGCPDVEYSMLITSSMENLLDSIDEASSSLPFDYRMESMAGNDTAQGPGTPMPPRKLASLRRSSQDAQSSGHSHGDQNSSSNSSSSSSSNSSYNQSHTPGGAAAAVLNASVGGPAPAPAPASLSLSASNEPNGMRQTHAAAQQHHHADGIRTDSDRPDSPQAVNLIEQPAPPAAWFCADDAVTKVRYFIIQGSTNFDHWAINFNFEPVLFEDPALGARIHRGVYEAALRLYDDLLPLVRQHLAISPSATVCFGGHSLGGSLATVLLLLLVHRKVLRPSSLCPSFTFGAPAVFCAGSGGIGASGDPSSPSASAPSTPKSRQSSASSATSASLFSSAAAASGAPPMASAFAAAAAAHDPPRSQTPAHALAAQQPACPASASLHFPSSAPTCSTPMHPHPVTHVASLPAAHLSSSPAAHVAPSPSAHRCDSCQLHCDAHMHSATDRADRDAKELAELRACGRRKPLLEQLGIAEDLIVNVMMHKDIVPRAFVCDYTVVADLLKQWMPSFKDHSNLSSNQQHKSLYNFLGRVAVLRPDDSAPFVAGDNSHPMLPSTPGLYRLRDPRQVMHISGSYDSLASPSAEPCARDSARHLHRRYTHASEEPSYLPSSTSSSSSSSSSSASSSPGSARRKGKGAAAGRVSPQEQPQPVTLRSAFLQFMNYPHPLQSLSLYESYGPQGAISRYHNPDNYTKGLTGLVEDRPAPYSDHVLAAALAAAAADVAAANAQRSTSGGSHGGGGGASVRAKLPLVSTRAGAAAMAAPLLATMGLLAVIGV